MLRNMLGPIFNLYLDQFLTYKCVFVFAWNPYFIVFSAKHVKFKETQNKQRHYLWTQLC